MGVVRRTYERARKCGVCRRTVAELVCVDAGAGASRAARWSGMVTCQSVHACPVCARKILQKRAAQVRAAVEGGRDACACAGCELWRSARSAPPKRVGPYACIGPRWRMLTLTIRHDDGLPLAKTRRLVLAALRRARQRGTVQRTWKAKVKATIRRVESPRNGSNGWHPHLHVLVLCEALTAAELAQFEAAYVDAVRSLAPRFGLSPARVAPAPGVGVVWSNARKTERVLEQSKYLAKMGWEIAGTGGRKESQWSIAERAARGDARAAAWWAEYVAAMAGCRLLECDERAAGFARARAELASLGTDANAILAPNETRVEIGAFRLLTLRDAERVRPTITRDVLIAAARAGPDPDAMLAAFDAECRAAFRAPFSVDTEAADGASLAA